MKLICIEEHVLDRDISRAALPGITQEAPYIALQGSDRVVPSPPPTQRPSFVDMNLAVELGAEVGGTRIAGMDQHGVDMQVLSYASPIQYVSESDSLAMARIANDRLVESISSHPDRFSGFAMLPWQVPGAAADELDRAVTELGLKGVLIAGRPGQSFLDDPRYRVIFKKLNELKVPLYLHPFIPLPQVHNLYYAGLKPEVSAQFSLTGWGWHHEAGVHLLRLILSGMFEEFPDLQIISGHWGEMVPFYLPRLDDSLPPRVTGLSCTISEIFRNHVWVTPSGIFDRPQFELVRSAVGIDRIIWSVDYPYVTLDGARSFIDNLELSEIDAHKIAHGNAEQLLGLGTPK